MSGKFSSACFLTSPSFWHCTILNMKMIPPAVCPSSKPLYLASVMSLRMDQAVSRTSMAPGTTDSPPQSRRPKTAFSIPATSCTSSMLNQTSPQSFSLRSVSGNEQVCTNMWRWFHVQKAKHFKLKCWHVLCPTDLWRDWRQGSCQR